MIWLIGPFLVGLVCGIPIAFSLILGTITYLLVTGGGSLDILAQQLYQASASFPLMAIPFFILAGDLMSRSGIALRIVRFLSIVVGRVTGGLAQVMILAGTVFAGLSGSGNSDTATLVKVLVPGMKEEGYDVGFSTGLAATTGVLGPIIPPSIPMIVYGSLMSVSIGGLFVAGVLPGLLICSFMMCTAYFTSKKKNYPISEDQFSWKALFRGFKDTSLGLFLIIIIIFGIRGGVFTPTEGGAVAVVYALILGIFVYRSIGIKDIIDALLSSGVITAVIMLIVAASNPYGWLLAYNQIPQQMTELIIGLTDSKYLILLLINIVLLFTGMLMETISIILLLAPILAPLAISVGVDPLHFGLIMIVNLCIGLITPPLGMNLYVAASTAGIKVETVIKNVVPFIIVQIICLMIITYLPQVVLVIPRLLGM